MKTVLTLPNRCMIIFESETGRTYGPIATFENINDALGYAEEEIDVRQQAVKATIIDFDNNNILAECTPSLFQLDNEDDGFDWNFNEDEGFDPYIGDFTNDC